MIRSGQVWFYQGMCREIETNMTGNVVSVRHVKKDEQKYYEELLRYSREHLMLYPYHLSDVLVKGLRVTPFSYYISITSDIMMQEKSYDALPNFTAADCKFSSLWQ